MSKAEKVEQVKPKHKFLSILEDGQNVEDFSNMDNNTDFDSNYNNENKIKLCNNIRNYLLWYVSEKKKCYNTIMRIFNYKRCK